MKSPSSAERKSESVTTSWSSIILTGIALGVTCLLSSIEVLSLVAVGILAFFVLLVVRGRNGFIFKYPSLLFCVVANVVGVASIELLGRAYLGELRQFTAFVGSLPLLCFAWWCLFAFIYWYEGRPGPEVMDLERRDFTERVRGLLPFFTLAVFVMVTVMFVRVLPRPSFVLGIDRFTYAALYNQGLWGKLSSLASFLVIIPLLSIRNGGKGRVAGVLAVAVYCLYLFWTGCKFGEFFTVACLFSFVYYDKLSKLDGRAIRRATSVALVAFVGIVAFSAFANSLVTTTDTSDFLTGRTAQQGQIWWSIYQVSDGQAHISDFLETEPEALLDNSSISESVGDRHGIYRAMYLSAPNDVVDSKLAKGSRYTEAGFACAYYYFGVPGVVAFGVATALVFCLIVNGILSGLREGRFVYTLVLVRFFALARTALSMFLFGQFFTPLSIACFAYLLISWLVRHAGASVNCTPCIREKTVVRHA